MSGLRTFFRVLIALVALWSANDALLQPYPMLGDSGLHHARKRLPILAVLPHVEDDDQHHLLTHGPALLPEPPPALTPGHPSISCAPVAVAQPCLAQTPFRARAPPLHVAGQDPQSVHQA